MFRLINDMLLELPGLDTNISFAMLYSIVRRTQ